MVITARDDELAAFKEKHNHTCGVLQAKEAMLNELQPICDRQSATLEDLHRQLSESRASQNLAEKSNDEARAQMVSQNESNQALLEKLLAEQRATFEVDKTDLIAKIAKFAEDRNADREAFMERQRVLTETFEKERQVERETVAAQRKAEAELVESERQAERDRMEARLNDAKAEAETKVKEARDAEAAADKERARVDDELKKAMEGREAAESEIKAWQLQAEATQKSMKQLEEAREKLTKQVSDLQAEIAKLKCAPAPLLNAPHATPSGPRRAALLIPSHLHPVRLCREKPKPVKKPDTPLKKTMDQLSEQNPAMPIPEKLGVALKKNSARVIDLFRQWDTDGDGGASPGLGH